MVQSLMLVACDRKPKIPDSSLVTSYVQGELLSAVTARLMSNCSWSGWKW